MGTATASGASPAQETASAEASTINASQLVRDYGKARKELPKEERKGMKLWLMKRLPSIMEDKSITTPEAIWKKAKDKWDNFDAEKRQRWVDEAQQPKQE